MIIFKVEMNEFNEVSSTRISQYFFSREDAEKTRKRFNRNRVKWGFSKGFRTLARIHEVKVC